MNVVCHEFVTQNISLFMQSSGKVDLGDPETERDSPVINALRLFLSECRLKINSCIDSEVKTSHRQLD